MRKRVSIEAGGARSGNTEVGLMALAFVLILLVLAGILFFKLRITPPSGPGGGAPTALTPGSAEAQGSAAPEGSIAGPLAGDPSLREGLTNRGQIEVPEHLPYKDETFSYEGALGKISGYVETSPGLAFPKTWQLLVEPSARAIGRQHAGRRVLDLSGEQRTFEVLDLPLGAYTVSILADGVDSRAQEVLLFRIKDKPNQAKLAAHLAMRLHPAATLTGVVRLENGTPAPAIAVTLTELGTQLQTSVVTNGAGVWSAQRLRQGHYDLRVGPPTKPLVEQGQVVHDGRAITPLEHTLPPVASARVIVFNKLGHQVPGVVIRGHGPTPVDVVTDPDGSILLPYLPPGRYELRAHDPLLFDEGKLTMIVKPGVMEQRFELMLSKQGG